MPNKVLHFKNDLRVKVITPPLKGRFGNVVRLRMSDDNAWVAMDEDIPEEIRSFPANDPHGRGNHVLLSPEDCEIG